MTVLFISGICLPSVNKEVKEEKVLPDLTEDGASHRNYITQYIT